MGIYAKLANAFAYPTPGCLHSLHFADGQFPDGSAAKAYRKFLRKVQQLSPGEWEELYTQTLDLNPMTAPYIGYQIWGESYQRGNFMAKLNQAYQELSLGTGGELPDHLTPVLHYLDQAETPIPESLEYLTPAVQKMQAELRKKDRNNPYIHLFEAVIQTARQPQPEN